MRQILFRGKRVDNGYWVVGELKTDPDLDRAYISWLYYFTVEGDRQRDFKEKEVDPETVGQYTGLIDKNGRKIFEGDILGFKYDDEDNHIVKFNGYVGFFDGFFGFVEKDYSPDILDTDLASQSEIIGNIYDNPELMEVS